MRKILSLLLVLCLSICIFAGCSSNKELNTSNNLDKAEKRDVVSTQNTSEQITFETISVEEAKRIMDTQNDYVILDVREYDEYNTGHIKNAKLLPVGEIFSRADEVIPNKNQLILVYCRSGNRSRKAASELSSLGYTNVKNFGGILDWHYEIEY